MLAVGRLVGRGAQAGDVGAGKGLGDGEAELLSAAEDVGGDLVPPGLVAGKVEDGRQANGHAGHIAVLEAAGHGAGQLLGDDHVVEVVKVAAVDGAGHELDAVQVLAGADAHVQDAEGAHAVNHVLADGAAGRLAVVGLGGELGVDEAAQGALEAAVRVLVVGVLEVRGEPEWLGVGHGAEVAGLGRHDLGRLAADGADGEAGVLGEHLVAVEVIKGRRGVLAGDLAEDRLAAGVGVDEVAEVIDGAVDDAPEGVVRRVLAHLVAGKGLVGHGGRRCCWCASAAMQARRAAGGEGGGAMVAGPLGAQQPRLAVGRRRRV